jgi:hypothetical protein
MNFTASLTAFTTMVNYQQMGLLFINSTALTTDRFSGYDPAMFNIILIPSS